MKKATIVGFGDVLRGDLGFGCYVLDALAQEPLPHRVELCYLASAYSYAPAYIYQTDLCAIVQALDLDGPAQKVYCWSHAVFKQNARWLAERYETVLAIQHALATTEMIGTLPNELWFLFMPPAQTEHPGLSAGGRKAVRTAVQILRGKLAVAGLLSAESLHRERIYRLPFLNCAA